MVARGGARWDLRSRGAAGESDKRQVLCAREAAAQKHAEEQPGEDGLHLGEQLEGRRVDRLQDEEEAVVVDKVDEARNHEGEELSHCLVAQQRPGRIHEAAPHEQRRGDGELEELGEHRRERHGVVEASGIVLRLRHQDGLQLARSVGFGSTHTPFQPKHRSNKNVLEITTGLSVATSK